MEKIKLFWRILRDKFFVLDVIFIALAFVVAFDARSAFVDASAPMQKFFFNGERILTTNDAYHYASATKDLLDGISSEELFFPSAGRELPAMLSVALYKAIHAFTPISLDLMFFMLPIFLCLFLIIPVYFITKEFSNRYCALFAAILAVLTQAYTNRSTAGYYDTDMLVLTFPLMSVYFLLLILKYNRLRDVFWCAVFCILAMLWHRASATYVLGFSVFLGICYAFVWQRKNAKIFASFGVLIIALSFIHLVAKIILIAIFLHFMSEKTLFLRDFTARIKSRIKYPNALIFALSCAVILLSNADLFLSKFALYTMGQTLDSGGVVVRGVTHSIYELQPIKLNVLIERVIGDTATFILALIGIILLFLREKRSIVLLSFLLLGIASMKLGSRFAMFAAPVFSIGFFYLVYFICRYAKNIFEDKIVIDGVKCATLCAFGYLAIAPNYYFNVNKMFDTVLWSQELSALNAIKNDSKTRENLTIAWWDYGFLTSYYANTRALISGIDMDGVRHFIASEILANTSQIAAYNLSKMSFNALYGKDSGSNLNLIEQIIAMYGGESGQKNPNEFFKSTLSQKKLDIPVEKNIYIYIPFALFDLSATIEQFSDVNLNDGSSTFSNAKLVKYDGVAQDGENFTLTSEKMKGEFIFNPKNGLLFSDKTGKYLQFGAFHEIQREGEAKLIVKGDAITKLGEEFRDEELRGKLTTKITQYTNDDDDLIMVYAKDFGAFYAIDKRTQQSLVVQLFLYENYDENLFELIFNGEQSKAYKLR